MNITALFLKMLALFFAIAMGFTAMKLRILKEETLQPISTFVTKISNPLLILCSALNVDRLLSGTDVLLLSGVAAIMFPLLILFSFLIPKILRGQKADAGVYRFLFVYSNLGFCGYPVIEALLGPNALFCVTIFVLFFQLFCWTYGVFLIRGESGRFRPDFHFLLNPCIISATLSYIIYCSGLRVPALMKECFAYVGNLTTPLAMLVLGASLSKIPFKTIFGNWRLYILAFLKLVLLPVAASLLLRPILTNDTVFCTTVVLMAMPSATNATLMSCQYGKNSTLASSGVFLLTLISIVTIPLMTALLF